MKINKSLMLGALGITVGLAGGLTGTALYTQAQTANLTPTNTTTPPTSIVGDKAGHKFKTPLTAEQTAKRQAVEDAINKGDYDAWKTAITDSPKATDLLKQIDTKEKFDKFAEAHKLMQEARTKADAIYTELGLTNKGGFGRGHKGMN
jgi:uncharacterized membrane protein